MTAQLANRDGVRLGAPMPARVDPDRWAEVSDLVRTGLASPLTTSMGRLFDAVSALCGIRTVANYEGQAAVELEAAADPAERSAYPLRCWGKGRSSWMRG